jgi:hypothetical protein
VPKQVGNILQDEIARLMRKQYIHDTLKQVAIARAIKSQLRTSFGIRLARNPAAEYIVCRNLLKVNVPNVTPGLDTKVLGVQRAQLRV